MENNNMNLKDKIKELEKTLQCNCDLDNWEPNPILDILGFVVSTKWRGMENDKRTRFPNIFYIANQKLRS